LLLIIEVSTFLNIVLTYRLVRCGGLALGALVQMKEVMMKADVTAIDHDLMTSKETASFLRVSASWLAKARMAGEGPPFMQFGRSVRYSKIALVRWMRSQQR
jgi:hypothetical protein